MHTLIRSMLSRVHPARVASARAVWLFAAAALAAGLTLSACDLVGGDEADEQQQAQQEAEPAAAAPAAPAASAPPEAAEEPSGPMPPPESSATSGGGADAYRIIFPSIARVDTDFGPLTALVSADGYALVTFSALDGAHSVSVTLSNGEQIDDVPVAGVDLLTDIAYLGPLDSAIVSRLPGAVLGDGEGLPLGAPVFAIGFAPDSGPGDPPSISSGVLSRLRHWEPGDRTFLVTDTAGVQPLTGAVLIDGNGAPIGFGTEEAGWSGLFVSTGDLARSLAMEPPMGLAARSRQPNLESAALEHLIVIQPPMLIGELALGDEATGEMLVLSVGADVEGVLTLIDAEGKILQESNLVVGATIVTLRPNTVGPYRLTLEPTGWELYAEELEAVEEIVELDEIDEEDGEFSEAEPTVFEDDVVELEGVSFSVSSNLPLMTLMDADDMQPLAAGERLIGVVDAPADIDRFQLPVLAGEVYEVRAHSLMIDMVLSAYGAGVDGFDDDSGGGFIGTDAMLTLAPETDGVIELMVYELSSFNVGAYVLVVERTVSVEGSDEADGDDATAAMAAPARLPDPQADLSLRGVITEDGLEPTLAGIGSSMRLSDNALLVHDEDGIFEVVVSIIGLDGSTARLFVMDGDGQIVISGRVVAHCSTPEPCLGSAIYIMPEDAPSDPGEWAVLLGPESDAITEWQIEVHLYSGAPFEDGEEDMDSSEAMDADEDDAMDADEAMDESESDED